jgi:hypothetical protein
MIVPHVAIVSSFLLAGNNPNIWEIATGRLHPEQHAPSGSTASSSDQTTSAAQEIRSAQRASLKMKSMFSVLWKPSFERTPYRSAWLWNRGLCKAMWIAKYTETYTEFAPTLNRDVQDMGFEGWVVSTSGVAVFLIVLPCFFSATIRYAIAMDERLVLRLT